MFWSGNYIAVRELNSLLKEENVTLSQVLEADDVLQECKAGNQALIQFLTRPEILAELVTLITEEPSKNIELSLQYRHASIACEVLTSHLPTLSDRLSMDSVQMNRLCDFIDREPPLNPLLASYFSKTIEMLLERSSKQWLEEHQFLESLIQIICGTYEPEPLPPPATAPAAPAAPTAPATSRRDSGSPARRPSWRAPRRETLTHREKVAFDCLAIML
ncbi:hypothetical protein MSG28_009453 [Choristoneura fumiferana]|uniref:Uncharacterized protein n=1 Tax=Choristoneura fumiferana TaxID=7141 RepID=A0ACC0JB68_CHOFU|nr:hypothetical protein MSG28_009453 [Choristoneura fumiferana]